MMDEQQGSAWDFEMGADSSFLPLDLLCLGATALAVLHQAEKPGLPSCSQRGVGELKGYIKIRICGINNNVETRKRYPMGQSY